MRVTGIFRSRPQIDRYLSERIYADGRLTEEIKAFREFADSIDASPAAESPVGEEYSAESLEIQEPIRFSEAAKLLYQWGYVCFPALVPQPLLEKLRREFEVVLGNGHRYGQAVDEFEHSTTVRLLMAEFDRSELKTIWSFFNSQVMKDFTRVYFRGEPFLFNYEIFAQQTGPTQFPPSGELHFDKRHTLKFWIYLDDTPAEAGAMRVVPGSIRQARRARVDFMARNAPIGELDNVVTARAAAVPVTGPAGTVFIHDTDAAHGAGAVENDRRRRIMRGHCRSATVQEWISNAGGSHASAD